MESGLRSCSGLEETVLSEERHHVQQRQGKDGRQYLNELGWRANLALIPLGLGRKMDAQKG